MRWILACCLLLALAGCAGPSVRDFPDGGVHVVQRGETLYSIATAYGLDWQAVARINGLRPPYALNVGQRIRLGAGGVKSAATGDSGDTSAEGAIGSIDWRWPTEGRVVSTFQAGHATRKGIDIAGRLGQPVHAAAAGEVVYSGSGLPGYGKLIILKHDARFLSAYAYNQDLLVSEGDYVHAGQLIAKMGHAEAGKPMLHFEIRLDGSPVDPLRQLPRR
ncbi:MAG: peptidoglycan DD-metalloendopeptidase family protein [Pseudomonadota bacterium]